LMMLGPAVAAATAVALWVAVDRPVREQVVLEQEKAPQSAVATNEPAPRSSAPAPPADAQKKLDDEFRAQQQRRAPVENAAAARKQTSTLEERPAAALPSSRPATTPETPRAMAETVQGVAGGRLAEPPPPAPVQSPVPPPAPPQQTGQTPAAPRQAAQARDDQPQQLDRLTSADKRARDGAAGRGAGREADLFYDRNERAGSFQASSPDASIRWRVVAGRVVQHSLDAGANWTTQYSADETVSLTAGAAPSTSVCWLVGRSGTVLRTTDARTWQRVKFPESVDLIAITSTDARNAIVTTADRRTFATSDGGQTWTRQ
jgi:hypothetical protein